MSDTTGDPTPRDSDHTPLEPDPTDRDAGEQWTRERLQRFRSGDLIAAYELFATHREYLVRLAQRLLSRSPLGKVTTADDLAQAAFVRALRARLFDEFRAERRGALRRALGTVLRYEYLDLARSGGEDDEGGTVPLGDDGPASGGTAIAVATAPPTPTTSGRTRELLALCRANSSVREWTIWQLRVDERLTFAQIARRVGDTVTAVRSCHLRHRQRLVNLLVTRGLV